MINLCVPGAEFSYDRLGGVFDGLLPIELCFKIFEKP